MANAVTYTTDNNAKRAIFPVLVMDMDADYSMPDDYAEEYQVLRIDASDDGGNCTITYPRATAGKMLFVSNEGATNSVIIKVTGQTGVTIPPLHQAMLLDNGTDFVSFGVIGYES